MENNLIVLVSNGEDGKMYIADKSIFSELAISNCYGPYGQKISCADAGDYVEILSSEAAEMVEEYRSEDGHAVSEVKKGAVITAYDDNDVFQMLFDTFFLEENGEKHCAFSFEKWLAYTFWDGHNWKTITLTSPEVPSFTEMVGDEPAKIIAEWENKGDDCEKEFGQEIYTCEKYEFTVSHFACSWALAEVEYADKITF